MDVSRGYVRNWRIANDEARRLHNLLLFYEEADTMHERLRSAESVARCLRRYLVDIHGLEGRR